MIDVAFKQTENRFRYANKQDSLVNGADLDKIQHDEEENNGKRILLNFIIRKLINPKLILMYL